MTVPNKAINMNVQGNPTKN